MEARINESRKYIKEKTEERNKVTRERVDLEKKLDLAKKGQSLNSKMPTVADLEAKIEFLSEKEKPLNESLNYLKDYEKKLSLDEQIKPFKEMLNELSTDLENVENDINKINASPASIMLNSVFSSILMGKTQNELDKLKNNELAIQSTISNIREQLAPLEAKQKELSASKPSNHSAATFKKNLSNFNLADSKHREYMREKLGNQLEEIKRQKSEYKEDLDNAKKFSKDPESEAYKISKIEGEVKRLTEREKDLNKSISGAEKHLETLVKDYPQENINVQQQRTRVHPPSKS